MIECLLKENEQLFSYIMSKLHFDDIITMSDLYYTNMLSLSFIVPAHWRSRPRIDMLHYLFRIYMRVISCNEKAVQH